MQQEKIDIKGIDKAVLLKALWEGSKSLGLSFLGLPKQDISLKDFEREIVSLQELNKEYGGNKLYFDYLMGRVIKCDIGGDELDPRLYDRDNGAGSAQRIINQIKENNKVK